MNLEKSSVIALWVIAISLLSQQLNDLNTKKITGFLNRESPLERGRSIAIYKNRNLSQLKDPIDKTRYKRRELLMQKVVARSQKICTPIFLEKSINTNIQNQLLLMRRMKNMVPSRFTLDWQAYTRGEMKGLITKENCLHEYLVTLLPYGHELEVDSFDDLLVKEKDFLRLYQSQFSWDPNWPDCPRYGYPACKKIEPEKWDSIAREDRR